MSDSTIRWESGADGVVTLTLDDPASSANTMNDAYVRSMGETIDRLERERDSVRGVVLTSAKKTFFAGGNLGSLIQATPETRDQVLAQVTLVKSQLRRLETLGVPVAAAINGAALGGGLEIALACHHRVVLDDPKVTLGFPEVTLGLLPGGGGIVRSVRLLGLTTALLELLLQGRQVRPDKAVALGLVHESAADRDELLAKARAWVLANPDAAQPWDTKGYKVPGGTPSSPSLASTLPAFPANLAKQLKGAPYPAPYAILSAAVESLQVDVDTAFTVEGRYFVDLVVGQISTNMIQALWFDLNRINGGGSRPAVQERFTVAKVGVLGAGMMGAGIAHAFAKVGVDVVLKDVSAEAAEKGRDHVAGLVGTQVSRGRMSREKADAFLARITPTGDAADLAGCDVVVEAVFEDTALKHRVLAEAEAHAASGALLASNTSTLPITGLATGVQRQSDVVGMHFFSPVDKMPLVELIVGEQTSDVALARAYDAVRQIGKTPIVVSDSRGFFTSRVFGTLVMEGAALLAEGVAPMSVERAALQAGFPAGPLTLLDEVTLTLPLKIRDEAARAGATDDHPGVAVLRTLVEHGRTGKSSGQGFFDWQPEKRVWPGLAELFPARDPQDPAAVPFTDAQERLLFAMAVETARCLEEQVLRTVEDANIGSIMGIGFPPLYGGVLQYVDQYAGGVAGFVARADALADRYGERFRPTAILLERAVPAGSLRAAAAV
ncbi:3-hydroxyacyl-CoA dehydrogenase NAD-binding domain-containing protein [Blastococcus sp. SYSU DS0541]